MWNPFKIEIGIVPILEIVSRDQGIQRSSAQASLDACRSRSEQMQLAKRNPEVCDLLMAECTITTAEFNALRAIRDGF